MLKTGLHGWGPKPLAQIEYAKGIGQWTAIATGGGSLCSIENLVENPGNDQDTEQMEVLSRANQDDKDDNVEQCLDELPVVHGAHARNET